MQLFIGYMIIYIERAKIIYRLLELIGEFSKVIQLLSYIQTQSWKIKLKKDVIYDITK